MIGKYIHELTSDELLKFEYREVSYFNHDDTYVFLPNIAKCFESKVHFDKRNPGWWTNESLNYKCISILCYKKD